MGARLTSFGGVNTSSGLHSPLSAENRVSTSLVEWETLEQTGTRPDMSDIAAQKRLKCQVPALTGDSEALLAGRDPGAGELGLEGSLGTAVSQERNELPG